jgi:hypothetical protein
MADRRPESRRDASTIFAWLVRQAIRHPRFLLATIVISFITMLFFEETRWNVVTEVWGIFVAGIFLWWVLEQQGTSLQEEIRILRHRDYLTRRLEEMVRVSVESISAVIDLPEILKLQLTSSENFGQREHAANRVLSLSESNSNNTSDKLQTRYQDYQDKAASVIKSEITVNSLRIVYLMNDIQEIVGEMSELSKVVGAYQSACRLLVETDYPDDDHLNKFMLMSLVVHRCKIANTSIGICYECYGILRKLGKLQ